MQKRFKVLISAYACEPGKGSEPAIGWNWVKQIGRFHEVWVITRSSNRESIEREKHDIPSNIHWLYFDFPDWFKFWKKAQRGVYLYYYLWQIAVYFLARRIHRAVNFDLVHHLTFGVYWLPSFLSLLPAPFIYGPLGGAESAPKEFYSSFSFRGKVYEWLRYTARWAGEKDPFVLISIRRARLVLARLKGTGQRLSFLGAKNIQYCSEYGISAGELEELGIRAGELEKLNTRNGNKREKCVVISVGRFLHWKGFHLGLKAFSKFVEEFPESEYWFLGDGPERRNLESMAKMLNVCDKVSFMGELPRHEVLKRLSESDMLVHPSLHDAGPFVCIEAMALGIPVLCLDLGGPGVQVTEETGIKLHPGNPEQAVEDLTNAMKRLAMDSSLGRQLGEAARRRVSDHFDWNKKGEWINKIYQEVAVKHELGK